METLSPKQAQELLEYITILVLGGDSDTPIEAIKLKYFILTIRYLN